MIKILYKYSTWINLTHEEKTSFACYFKQGNIQVFPYIFSNQEGFCSAG